MHYYYTTQRTEISPNPEEWIARSQSPVVATSAFDNNILLLQCENTAAIVPAPVYYYYYYLNENNNHNIFLTPVKYDREPASTMSVMSVFDWEG